MFILSYPRWKISQIISSVLIFAVLITGEISALPVFLLGVLLIIWGMQRLWYVDTKVFLPLSFYISLVTIYYSLVNLLAISLVWESNVIHFINTLVTIIVVILLWQLGLKYMEVKYIQYSMVMIPQGNEALFTKEIREILSNQQIVKIVEYTQNNQHIDAQSKQQLMALINQNPVDQVVIIGADHWNNQALTQQLLDLGIVVEFMDDDLRLIPEPLDQKHHLLLAFLMDKLIAIVGLIICLLAGLVIGIWIKIEDGGPILYTQKRVGRNGRVFDFYKFRSMKVNSDQITEDLLNNNEMSGLMFKLENDPRITRMGKFIRKTSIDELPQFYNILIGDMSIVGTRPPTLGEYKEYSIHHKKRLGFKVGLTGNWQVSGRNEITDFDEVIQLDTDYMCGWNFARDIQIILKTFAVVLKREGAK